MSSTKLWPQEFSLRLHKLREEKMFTDINIVVGDEVFSAHRSILIAASDYFLHMFTGSMIEASLPSVPIAGISACTFKKVLDFIYALCSESVVDKLISEDNVEDLLHAADMLQINALKKVLTAHILKNVSDENMLAVYALGWKYNISAICGKTSKAISKAFPKLVDKDEFKLMDVQCLKALFSNPYLQSSNENKYCKAIVAWFNFDVENREKHFDEVMSLFCYHNVGDLRLKTDTVGPLYKKRGKKREYATACGNNRRCPKNIPGSVKSLDDLYKCYGDRCIRLSENTELMNTFQCKYTYYFRNIPNEFMKMEISENDKTITFEEQICHGDHHYEVFHQDVHNADHCFIVTGNYRYLHCAESTLGIFSRLPKVRLIVDVNEDGLQNDTPNLHYVHQMDPSRDTQRMWRYPYMLVIAGAEVDMDDAVRFACSLIVKNTGKCGICMSDFNSKGKRAYHYLDIWSPALEKKRSDHFGYET